ncbi:MAG: bifunctional UDP-N-acetylglucosamine diphosphorylase/glucosamine-1-phosphate N-acetyltransferase GlmU [Holosporales bacterium]|jgi:bifunctional UDP-N-acetylglucosamine pyrophosphorylase/glucosamine-1-phosphate N-acetyltransferase|nr:bifunctional UDP-N-acetylglucosamine diphosphorylase/glucosamine-1-phosphate N-acetyltransferase GlmU [Holosporales bacterium]
MENISSIILAAGKGTRFKSEAPKVCHNVGGLMLFCHVVKSCIDSGIKDIVLVVSPTLSDIYNEIPASFNQSAKIRTAIQSKPLGTGDAALCGFKQCSEKSEWIIILYGDTPLIQPKTIESMLQAADNRTGVVILAINPENEAGYARLVSDQDGDIFSIVEEKDTASYKLRRGHSFLSLCNVGMLIRRKAAEKLLNKLLPSSTTKEIYITNIISLAREDGWICRYVVGKSQELKGINNRTDLAVVEKSFQEKMRASVIENGVELVSPETVYFSHDTIIEPGVKIHPFVTFGRAVTIRSGSEIRSFCAIEGAEIKSSAIIGPFARIRPGTLIQENSCIGNFVEVKKSNIGSGTKISHLSYIGDTSTGSDVNIGAGTITCNYDGFKKSKTNIGNKASVGANSSLIAPINIGARAILGAGSVVTEDVPDDALALGRAPQIILKGKAEKLRKKRAT